MNPQNTYPPQWQQTMGQYQQGPQPTMGQYPSQTMQPSTFQRFVQQNNNANSFVPGLSCHFVDDPEKIMPIDVPTDGQPAFFVARNFSAIYAKGVNNQGTIDTIVYQPVKRSTADEDFKNMVLARFNGIDTTLNTIIEKLCPTQEAESTPKRGGK